MARNATTNQRLNGTWTIAQGQSLFTMAGWIRRPSSNSYQFLGSTTNSTNLTSIVHWNDNNIYCSIRNSAFVFSYVSQNVTGWNHYTMVFNGNGATNTDRVKFYFNGVLQTLIYSGTMPSTTSSNTDNQQFNINRWISENIWGNGDYAEIAAWQEALTAEEISSLAKGFSPSMIRPNKLGMYLPLVREINDIKGHITLTDTNTTVATHPRVYA